MEKTMSLIFLILFSVHVLSQVGINTSNPQDALHIDGAKDNSATGAPSIGQQANDIIVTSTGNVGVGTTTPSTRLDIHSTTTGAIKIIDGSQSTGRVLTTDANGVGTWQDPAIGGGITTVTGVTPQTNTPYAKSTDLSNAKYMNGYIDLPTGKWFVYMGFLVNGATVANTYYCSRLALSSSNTVLQDGPGYSYIDNNKFLFNQTSNGDATNESLHPGMAARYAFGMFTRGVIKVNVTSATPIRLYLWDANSREFAGSNATNTMSLNLNGEDYLFAIKAN
ncbi:hypothetical protein D1632_01835 [Chryseobacterium nematophagum]|uniref:C1q domain-containing protein n=1 Tax=Chryseobacterium nematophagum TaxID=2305228 RepID=A0A3M7LF69_9FLAO|nr:hypothetical protein [Chryseobacterium nematophagum]RMZ60744.1 hypothetical protein D1632_01835 [Chryseobacterium nematophagum]